MPDNVQSGSDVNQYRPLPLGSFVPFLRFSMVHTVESSSLLSLVGMLSLMLSVIVARLSINAYSDSLQPVFIRPLKSFIVAR